MIAARQKADREKREREKEMKEREKEKAADASNESGVPA